MKKILITVYGFENNCKEGYEMLQKEGFEIISNPTSVPLTKEQLLDLVPDVDAVIVGVDVWDKELYAKAEKLKLLARYGIGLDNIDLEGAKEHGIIVANAPGSINGAAELALAFMMMLKRSLIMGNNLCKNGQWNKMYGTEMKGSKIGLLGYGRIAKILSKKLQSFEAEVLAYDLMPDYETAEKYNVKITSFEEVIKTSDIISCHLPSTPETRKILNKESFSKMKDGAFFINTSRGANVDEVALYNALKSRKIAGAALDVFEVEPVTKDNPLFTLDNFIGTPHWGSDTFETAHLVGMINTKAIIDVICKNLEPENYINK